MPEHSDSEEAEFPIYLNENDLVEEYLQSHFHEDIIEAIVSEYSYFPKDSDGYAMVDPKMANLSFYEYNLSFYGYFNLMKHFSVLPYSNANMERVFSKIKGLHESSVVAKSLNTLELQSFLYANKDLVQLLLVNQFLEMIEFIDDDECTEYIDMLCYNQIHPLPEMPRYNMMKEDEYQIIEIFYPDQTRFAEIPMDVSHMPYLSPSFPLNITVDKYRRLIGMLQKHLQIDFFLPKPASSRLRFRKYNSHK